MVHLFRWCGSVMIVLALTVSIVQGQGGPGGVGGAGGPCTNLGCLRLNGFWSPGLPLGPTYCIEFINGATGRYVRNAVGVQGGSPCSTGGTQTVLKGVPGNNCPHCAPPNPATNQNAIHVPSVGWGWGQFVTFGNYGCKAGPGQPCI